MKAFASRAWLVGWLPVSLLIAGCANQGEGERCDTHNYSADCDSNLQCTPINGTSYSLCCPIPPDPITVAACNRGSTTSDSGTSSDATSDKRDASDASTPDDAGPESDAETDGASQDRTAPDTRDETSTDVRVDRTPDTLAEASFDAAETGPTPDVSVDSSVDVSVDPSVDMVSEPTVETGPDPVDAPPDTVVSDAPAADSPG